ncbi:6456_t:CDS:2 [Scutellospora calospora]|uniref:6456_t:CDS:1 n=1 Tax=Scutellospora calospora TaxID=85575 RepID=A0ACA9KHF0_9GLOM|nr:6456_t:CDS:2 [Scutellospora calospora]
MKYLKKLLKFKKKFANSYKIDIELHLASAGTFYRGIDILANTKLTVSSKTILRYKQQIVENHFDKINKYFNEQINYLYIFNLNNFYSIHEIYQLDTTFLSSVKHFVICIAKKINLLTSVLANYDNIFLFNPVNIDAENLCEYLSQKYSSLFDISYNNSKL